MKIIEFFKAIQGEGIKIGTPTFFIRTFGCNLKCAWCDSKFTFNDRTEYKDLTVSEIVKEIEKSHLAHLDITGGEPLIQQDLYELILASKKAVNHITVETNCTIYPEGFRELVDLWAVSPKLKGSKQHYNEDTLKRFVEDSPKNVQLKFVVISEEDIKEIEEIIKRTSLDSAIPLIIQPNGELSVSEYIRTSKWLVSEIERIQRAYSVDIRYIPQIHRQNFLPYVR